jgi:hypothetical protein
MRGGADSGMTRSRGLGVVVAAILALCGAQGAPAAGAAGGPLTVRPASGYHRLPLAYAGFNAPFRRNSWQARSPRLHTAVAGLAPGAIRVFGGTTANYWDWRTGKLLDLRGVPPRIRQVAREMSPIYLSDWAKLVKDANAIPVFDLNMVTSTLPDQLAMLSAAEGLGMPIRRIELGNELYYAAPRVVRAFPTPASYGREASRWIEAIKARYPKAQIAAVGLGYPPPADDERQLRWDRAVRRTLHGEDALTFHAYWPASRDPSPSGRELVEALAAPLRLLRSLRADGLSRLPKGVSAWVTEWNLWHGAGYRGTWTNGLADAAYLLGLLAEPSINQEDLHPLVHSQPLAALFGNPSGFHAGGPPTVRYAPTAVGEAIGELYPALWGGARVRRLDVPRAPKLRDTGIAAVRGVGIDGRGALLVNLSGRRQRLELRAGLACDGTLDSVWARPSARITGQPGQVRHATSQAHGSVALPAHSVNRLSC